MDKTPITFDDWLIHFFMQNQVWWTAQCILLVQSHHHVHNCNTFQGVTILKSQPGVKVRMKLQPGQDLFVQLDSQLLSIFFSVFFCSCMEACSFLVSLHPRRKLTGFVIHSDPAALQGQLQKQSRIVIRPVDWLVEAIAAISARRQKSVLIKENDFFAEVYASKAKAAQEKKKNPIVNEEKVSDCALFVCLLIVWKLYG